MADFADGGIGKFPAPAPGPECYIPLDIPKARERARAILAEMARRLGVSDG